MKLENCRKIGHGKCEKPEDTIQRLETMIGAHHQYRLVEEKVSDTLYWTALEVDELGFRSMGKGVTPELSKAGALAEAAEWLTARDTAELAGYVAGAQQDIPQALPIEDLLVHISSLDEDALNRIKETDNARYWVDGFSLIRNAPCKVPLEYVRQISGPNGCASGNRIEEAIVHATNEIFERRAHITVLKDRMVVPTIDPDSIEHPVLRDQISFIRSKGIQIWIKDLSFGGQLPCIGAYFLDPHIPTAFQFHHFFKVGASFNRELALMRTFTEYAQGRRRREFLDSKDQAETTDILKHDFRALRCMAADGTNFLSAFMFGMVALPEADFLKAGEIVPFDMGPGFDDCLEDIEQAKSICEAIDRDMVVVDLTNPDYGFPVVQVIIPGYSDVLPFHPPASPVLYKGLTRGEALVSYE